jgi:hypothetical protein
LEAVRKAGYEADGFDAGLVEIDDGPAAQTNKMVMGLCVGFDTERPVMGADFTQQAVGEKRMNSLIYGAQRDSGDFRLNGRKDFLRARMTLEGA